LQRTGTHAGPAQQISGNITHYQVVEQTSACG
jgi:hypothetical protein